MGRKFTHRKPLKLRGTRLLAAIVQFILEEPKRFNMQIFTQDVSNLVGRSDEAPACGTVACLAGWADVLTTGYVDTNDNGGKYCGVEERAMKVLGLDRDEANRLFYVDNWPYEFRGPYNRLRYRIDSDEVRQTRADLAAARVQAFIVEKRKKQKQIRDARYRANRKARLAAQTV